MEFSTPADRIGTFEVVVRYAMRHAWDGQKQAGISIPLVLPLDDEETQFTGQQVEFTLPDGVLIATDAETVDELDRPPVSGGATYVFGWSNAVYLSQWMLEPSPETKAASVMVSQMWVQTWLAPQVRQERVAMRLSTMQETIRLRLPKPVRQASVQAAIDSQEVPGKFQDPGILVVSVPPELRGRPCVLEVFYALQPPASQFGLTTDRLEAAKIDDAAPPKRVYWQLAIPEREHLLLPPEDLAKEMAWTVDRGFLRAARSWISGSSRPGSRPVPKIPCREMPTSISLARSAAGRFSTSPAPNGGSSSPSLPEASWLWDCFSFICRACAARTFCCLSPSCSGPQRGRSRRGADGGPSRDFRRGRNGRRCSLGVLRLGSRRFALCAASRSGASSARQPGRLDSCPHPLGTQLAPDRHHSRQNGGDRGAAMRWVSTPMLAAANGALFVILSLACAEAADEKPTPLTFRRLYVPADALDSQIRGLLPMKRSEFERRIGLIQEAGKKVPGQTAAHIEEATFRARFDGRQLNGGSAELSFVKIGSEPTLAALEPCNLALEAAAWIAPQRRAAFTGIDASGQLRCLVEQSGTLELKWHQAAAESPASQTTFELRLPPALRRRLEIEASDDVKFEISAGLLVSSDKLRGNDHQRLWIFDLSGGPRVELRGKSSISPSELTPQVIVRESTTYNVIRSSFDVESTLSLDVLGPALERLQLQADAALEITAVRLGEQSLSFSATPAADAKHTLIAVELPAELSGVDRTLEITAVGDWPGTGSWSLPRIGVRGAELQEARTTLTSPAWMRLQARPLAPQNVGCRRLDLPRAGPV